MTPKTAGHKQMHLIFLIHAMHILREPSLVTAIYTPKERDNNLASVIMSADNQIHIPIRRSVTKYKTVRPVRHHNLQPFCILKVFHEYLGIFRCCSCTVASIKTERIIIHTAQSDRGSAYLKVLIRLIQNDSSGFLQFIHQLRMTILDIRKFMVSQCIIDRRRFDQSADQITWYVGIVRIGSCVTEPSLPLIRPARS